MFKKTLLASTAALSLVLTACNDPKDANKENFGKAISEYLDTQPAVCINYPKSSFKLPIESSLNNEEQVVYPISGQFKSLYEDSVKQATYLAEKGLFTEETQSISVKDILGGSSTESAKVYSPTEKLKSYLVIKDRFWGNKLCTGKVTLDQVGIFTEPAEAMGMKFSRVYYTVKVSDLADWAADPKFSELFKGRSANKVEGQQRMALILTSEGWKSEHLMKGKR
ncbi:hypothetical protein O3886_06025 [Haemophilus sputorum]|uniref:hypothetical protein n=1 Tax=Haemophilus sputorum TaxID=1078480 RepID=UPI00352D38D5